MPDNYTNPNSQIGKGAYTWIPATPKNIGGVNPLSGFNSLEIDRGAFRNCYYNNSVSNNIQIFTTANTSIGKPYYPIRNTTRPLELGGIVVDTRGIGNVYCVGADKDPLLIAYTNIRYSDRPMSTIECLYDLSFDINGPIANTIASDKKAIFDFTLPGGTAAYAAFQTMRNTSDPGTFKSNESILLNFLNSQKNFNLLDFSGILNASANTTYSPILIDNSPVGLNITRIRSSLIGDLGFSTSNTFPNSDNVNYTLSETKLISSNALTNNTHNDRNQYKAYKNIGLTLNSKIASYLINPADLVLCLKQIKFYTADRVNFRFSNEQQLPAQALGYSMTINAEFVPIAAYTPGLSVAGGTIASAAEAFFGGVFYVPPDLNPNGCNIHVKAFNPDYTSGSPGFAHSLSLHLIVISFPLFGPLANALLPGVLLPYFAVLTSPSPFPYQLVYYGTSKTSSNNQIAVISQGTNQITNGTVSIYLDDTPLDKAQNLKILNYSSIVNAGANFVNFVGSNSNYLEVPAASVKANSSFRNVYTDIYGSTTYSNAYKGSPERKTTYFYAYDNLPFGTFEKKSYTYQSYVMLTNPSLNDLFATEPCIVFKLSTTDYIPSNLDLSPGFITTRINANVTDPVGLFETKLVYRIYAVKKTSIDFGPNSDDAKAHHLFIDTSDPQNYSLKVTSYDPNTWSFDNVIVTGDLIQYPTYVTAEVVINVNSKFETITNFFPEVVDYDFYCAVYALSTPSDSVVNYNLTKTSSLSFPLVTFNLKNDFVLTMPLFYKKSFNNGGYLQAQKDPNYFGNYIPDKQKYSITLNTYGGATFDVKNSYNFALSQIPFNVLANQTSSTALTNILVSDYSVGLSTSFFTTIAAGSESSPTLKSIDFLISAYDNLSDAKIAQNSINKNWNLHINVDKNLSTFTKIAFKFELDLIDNNLNFLQKIVSSSTNDLKIGVSSVNLNVNWSGINYYLAKNPAFLILRLVINNYGADCAVGFSDISLTNNLINYFDYNTTNRTQGTILRADPGYYEDLQLQPASFLDGFNQFYFLIDYSSLSNDIGAFIFDPNNGIYITGAIYSPTWILDSTFTKGMEIKTKGDINLALNWGAANARGISPYQIFFRTGIGNEITSIDTKKHGQTQLILTVTNQKSVTSNNSVLQIVSESYNRCFLFSTVLTQVLNNGDITELNIQNPILATSDKLYLQGQTSGTTVLLELDNPAAFAMQPTQVGTIAGIDNPNSIRPKLTGCIFTDLDCKDNATFSVGVTGSGCLIYATDVNWASANNPQFYCIEGNPKAADILSNSSFVVIEESAALGIINKTFPSLCATQSGDVLVFYVYSSSLSKNNPIISNTAIYMKYINGQEASPPILFFDFKEYLVQYGNYNSNNSFPNINNISVCKDDIYSEGVVYYLAFDCLQKIFILKFTYRQHNVRVVDVAWIYGLNGKTTNIQEQYFVDALNVAVNNARIKQFQYFETGINTLGFAFSKNLPNSQRVGFVDFDGFFMGVQFTDNLDIYEILFDKSFAIPAVLRKIGTKSG
jgi:hypothetical protein